jgi:2-keto-4-pentenoate hydratase/2-oxohepta-3-ene-1,7-dioic acid hydratase in catechol pathway
MCRWLLAAGCLLPPSAVAQGEAGSTPPRIMRYVSYLGELAGQTCFGLVMEDRDGIPHSVCNLGRHDRALCATGPAVASSPWQVRRAFAIADDMAARAEDHGTGACAEALPLAQLAEVVHAPVGISLQQLASGQRFIVGIGLNYRAHRAETGADEHAGLAPGELLVFPKFVEPTGPYAPVRPGAKIGADPVLPVQLLDYEVELAMLLLEDLDLKAPPASYSQFIDGVAFFTANDVSDREPIILDSGFGYTRGKSHPTYLPAGPWMIHGRHLQPLAPGEGRDRLELALVVREPAAEKQAPRARQLQASSTDRMILGPWQIIRQLAARYREGLYTCMRDAAGQPRYTHTPAGIIPAGSIILTGTPGGTAIREPGPLKKLGLFLRGGFSLSGARHRMILDSEAHIRDSRYLEPGDQVDTSITRLGRQRWNVAEDTTISRYGIDIPGDCSSVPDIDQPAGE